MSGINAVSDSLKPHQLQGRPVVTQSQNIPLVQPSMAYKRLALNAEVVKPNKSFWSTFPRRAAVAATATMAKAVMRLSRQSLFLLTLR